jgi:transcription termination factor Rho
VDIAELQSKNVGELHDLAEELKLSQYHALRKQDLVLKIEHALLERGDSLTSEGVLEILPEGYGFLRSQVWSYVSSPDDVYVSPAQIKALNLRTGDTLVGEVRPPRRRSAGSSTSSSPDIPKSGSVSRSPTVTTRSRCVWSISLPRSERVNVA